MSVSARQQYAIGGMLALLLVATRGHHFPTLHNMLPSASGAVFFLAGMYLRPLAGFALLFALAACVDYAAIVWGGVSSFCVSSAYAALLPAYGSLWLAGRMYANRCGLNSIALLPLAASVFIGAVSCELISSGSFYAFSGRFAEPTWIGFSMRLAQYFPASLTSLAFWVSAVAAIQTLSVFVRGGNGLSLFKR
ncbi:conserved membrane protein of unknown function [Georgfuchsia toluolica]|uniref:Uncharacterized protein n=1 Tax=Georgfuchsia toluolica TaxID=424218 RepID=A0A916J4Y1_9PROT|nr:hypothetical protein [Georgfuchsia toluolica]CAG4884073.1 conserved membrane protein of unknown function [Georgfuchsia toluolica]